MSTLYSNYTNMKKIYLTPPPPNVNLILDVYNSLCNESLTLCVGKKTGLLAHFGLLISYDLRSSEGLSAILCLATTGLKCKVQKSVLPLLTPPLKHTCTLS